ncbi:squalene-associated FAD-dependent desaturase [Gallionella capsiferriformans ES-2]|uniref:Squalene-associated FAD-dependent desaturase n=1 Tax=Gallionella capsiferriformans (strain ES-2) TaxID=395494 RepID=D9SGU9_GALCS|nr:squalene-associated FAD-dependent desaturase [Gallionella capsiferriformans ES-2]
MARLDNLDKELNIAVIGGGYAGMAAAVRLAEQGMAVTVFESAKSLGGRARGVAHRHAQLDNGQHLLLGCYRDTLRLIEQVGGDLDADFLRLPLQLDLHGHFSLKAPKLPAPLHLLVALLRAQGLTWRERLSAARFMLLLRRMNFRLDSDMTASALLARHGQSQQLVEKLWEPLCIAALNTPVAIASAQVLLNVLRDALNQKRADSDMLIPRLDFTALFPARAAAYVKRHGGHVLTSCAVERLLPHNIGMEIVTKRGSLYFSHVICATPAVTTARLLRDFAELAPVVAQIDALAHQPIYTVYLQYPPHVTLPHPMLGLHQRYSQWLFDKGQISGQPGLIASVISAEGHHQALSQDELAQKVIAELSSEFGFVDAPLWFRVIAEKRATFACTPDLQRPAQQTPLSTLLLAGDYTRGDYPATLEGAVRSGILCAERLKA